MSRTRRKHPITKESLRDGKSHHVSGMCRRRDGGGCRWCQENRTHKNRRRAPTKE